MRSSSPPDDGDMDGTVSAIQTTKLKTNEGQIDGDDGELLNDVEERPDNHTRKVRAPAYLVFAVLFA